ncbi:Uncharacterized protein APZ42_019705 [Daphnia magna]|uniref:Secreted protein n=1 Tax=Daphnia magna TaxID=35525 RepID=A0A164Y4G5_9CRUS|nr:Uncharacterized protein APZ42_019705 [Daphnia magna]
MCSVKSMPQFLILFYIVFFEVGGRRRRRSCECPSGASYRNGNLFYVRQLYSVTISITRYRRKI